MPNKIVLAFEGMDGAGKSSLSRFARKVCDDHGFRFTIVGRREPFANAVVNRLTRLLAEEASNLTPPAETFIRIAREHERAALVAAARPGVVVLDRFVLSCLALARFQGQDVEPLTDILKEITARANLHATVFVRCSFEVARNRVRERRQTIGLTKNRDERFLRRLAELMEEDFQRGILTGQQWVVDNSDAREAAEEQLISYLVPYLQKGQRSPDAPPLVPEGTGEDTIVIRKVASGGFSAGPEQITQGAAGGSPADAEPLMRSSPPADSP
jgi:thymidylate kinase